MTLEDGCELEIIARWLRTSLEIDGEADPRGYGGSLTMSK